MHKEPYTIPEAVKICSYPEQAMMGLSNGQEITPPGSLKWDDFEE